MEIIDHRLVGAVHLAAFDRDGAEAANDGADDDGVFQTSTIEALLDGAYEGDLTVGDVLAHGDLGVGTVDHLDGELVVLDGVGWVVAADGTVRPVGPEEGTPFAAVCHFRPRSTTPLAGLADFEALTAAVDDVVATPNVIAAVRLDGVFPRVVVRSVARQEPPYPPLREVVAHQSEWTLTDARGSLVGFRFPDATSGLEVPGWHLHFLSDDRRSGGHVVDVAVDHATLTVDTTVALHLELPRSVRLPGAGGPDRTREIRVVEGREETG